MGRHVSKAWLLIFLWLLPCWAQELAEWITSLGGFVSPKLEIKEQADAGHGLFANESVQQGETLLSIPFNAIFFGEKAVKLTPCHRRIRDFFDTRTHPENVRTQAIFSIIVFLLQISTDWEARKNWPHLDSLLHHWDKLQHAEHHLRFPLFWTPEMMSEISGTTAFEIYSTARMGVEREYTEVLAMVCPKLASGSSLQSYKHIWTLVNSRVLTFPGSPLDGLPAQPALVPMFDMVNHQLPIPERPLQTEDQVTGHLTKSLGRFGLDPPRRDSQSSSKLHMWLQSSIQSGEEVTDVYGLHSNQEMLWNFGFTVPWIHNLTCLTKVRLSLELQQVQHELPEGGAGFSTDLLRSLQHVLHFEFDGCARSKVSEDSAEQSNQFGIPGLLSIVAFLRAWIASARASLPELHRTCSFASPEALMPLWLPHRSVPGNGRSWLLSTGCPYLTIQDERRVLKTLSHFLQEKMLGMKGSMKNDDQTLKSQDVTGSQRDAIILRQDERHLLASLRRWLKQKVKTLSKRQEL